MALTEIRKFTYQLNKYIKVKNIIKVQIVGKNLINNKAQVHNVGIYKSLMDNRARRLASTANKNFNIFGRVLKNTAKSETIIIGS